MLRRNDGRFLLYAKKLTWLSSAPEGFKTWIALIVCVEALQQSAHVIFVDFEGDPAEIVDRLRALGATDDVIVAYFHYFRPHDPLTAEATVHVLAAAQKCGAYVSVIDGVNEAMGASGFNPNDSTDFYRWWNMLGEKLSSITAGPTIAIDHVVKSLEERKQYASGTGQKLAKVDVHLGFEVVDDFGRGLTGRANIVVHKDRAGHLRGISEKKLLGVLVLVSHPDGHVEWRIDAPLRRRDEKGEPIPFRPTTLMERISRHLERVGTPQTQRSIREQVPGDNNAMRTAVSILAQEGYVVEDTTKKYATYRSIRPYREKTDSPPRAESERSESGLKAVWTDRGDGSGLRSVSPVRGQTGTDHDQATQTGQSGLRSDSDQCPHCGRVDYRPLDGGWRECHKCKGTWRAGQS